MRYIQKLRLENFQSHEDTILTFEPGINLIVGSSDSGKSAILRAINFLFHNPRNVNYLRMGTSEVRVTAWFNDGTIVSRVKGKTRNGVTAQMPDGSQYAFEKIGQEEYPREILEALGNPPEDKVHGPISYSEQLGQYFLASLGPTELPRSISELTGIDDLEEAAGELGKKSKQAGKQLKDTEERISDYECDLEQYANLDNQLTSLELMDEQAIIIDKQISDIVAAGNLLSRYEILRTHGREISQALKKAQAITKFTDRLPELRKIKETISAINELIRKYGDTVATEDKAQRIIEDLKKITTKSIKDTLIKAKKLQGEISEVTSVVNLYNDLNRKGIATKSKHIEWSEKLNDLIEERNQIMIEMKDQGMWCDKCNRPLAIDICKESK